MHKDGTQGVDMLYEREYKLNCFSNSNSVMDISFWW